LLSVIKSNSTGDNSEVALIIADLLIKI